MALSFSSKENNIYQMKEKYVVINFLTYVRTTFYIHTYFISNEFVVWLANDTYFPKQFVGLIITGANLVPKWVFCLKILSTSLMGLGSPINRDPVFFHELQLHYKPLVPEGQRHLIILVSVYLIALNNTFCQLFRTVIWFEIWFWNVIVSHECKNGDLILI